MRIYRNLIPVAITGVIITLFASCQQELSNEVQEKPSLLQQVMEQKAIVLSAYYDDDQGGTKTSYESASGHILWSPGNQISLFYGSGSNGGSCFTATNDAPVQRTQFSGTIGVITGITEDSDDYYFWGIYPYSTQNSCDGSTVTAVVPHEQTAVAETFNEGEFVAIGKSAGLVMGFYNLCGAFYVKVTRNDITKITLKGKGDETLAGQVKIRMSTGVPVVADILNGEHEVTLTRPNGAAFTPGVGYFISCLPNRFNTGFCFEMETSGGLKGIKEYNIDFTLERNRFQPFNAAIDDGVVFISDVQQNNEIRYTTIDGSLLPFVPTAYSYLDPYDEGDDIEVSLVSHQYVNGVGIMTFSDDIVYAGVQSSIIQGKDKLASISFPASIKKLGSFYDYPNLASVTILGNLEDQTYNPFEYCPNLESFSGPNASIYDWLLVVNNTAISFAPKLKSNATIARSNITRIGYGCFRGATSLKTVNLSWIERIDERAFDGCSDLMTVYCDAVNYIGDEAFVSCSSLYNIILPTTLTIIGEGAFSGCNSLTNIDLPSSLRWIKAGAFTHTGLTNITLPASIESIGDNCFGNNSSLESVTVCAVTPPVFTSYSENDSSYSSYTPFHGTYPIYVPKNSLNNYMNHEDWSKYSSRLQSMNLIMFMDPTAILR